MSDWYFPTRDTVSRRNSSNRTRSRSVYGLPPEYSNADTDELLSKLEQARTLDHRFCCYLCGVDILADHHWHLDHLHPLALGGTHTVDNLYGACQRCNLSKSDLRLEDFLKPIELEEFRRAGWPPPFETMRDKPVDELFAKSPEVAKKFARRPREVPAASGVRWGSAGAIDDKIRWALKSNSESHVAMSLSELAALDGVPGPGPLRQAWEVAMGLYTTAGNPGYLDRRYRCSPHIVPTRTPKPGTLVGVHAFRLRFDRPGGTRGADKLDGEFTT
jgi:5-methylcytosine-specific restriction endonuclease McrA